MSSPPLNPHILAIDTASTLCSVACGCIDTIFFASSTASRRHADDVLPLVRQSLDANGLRVSDLDAIAIISGPGSFTGLRIGAAVAQGLAFGADLPIISVTSLALQAFSVAPELRAGRSLAVLMHARESSYYFAVYDDKGHYTPRILISERVLEADALGRMMRQSDVFPGEPLLIGEAWRLLHPQSDPIVVTPDARTLLQLASVQFMAGHSTTSPEQAIPLYLSDELVYRTVEEQS